MKKILFFAFALAGLFFAASCQQENLEPVPGGNTVTYTVQIPDAIGTKAVGDDVKIANVLHYEVYRTKNDETTIFSETEDNLLYHKAVKANNDGTFTIVLELINNQNFTVLLWAHYQESLKNGENLILVNEAYNVADLTKVTIKTPLDANQLDYAAFAGHHFIKANVKDTEKVIKLHRPVAQLNIGTSAASLTAFNEKVDLISSSVSVKGLSNSYNVATKAAGAVYDGAISYDVQPVLKKVNDEGNYEYETFNVGTTAYPYVGMNYVGFAATEGSTIKVSYLIKTTEGDITNTIENVPVKANYRTNIVGNLITSMTDYTVELDQDWGPEGPVDDDYVVEVVSVSTVADLVDAINGASTTEGEETNIKLEGDINLSDLFASLTRSTTEEPKSITIKKGLSATIDLNGYSITGVDEGTASFGLINNSGNLTITNSSSNPSRIALKAKNDRDWNAYSSVISNNPGGNLLVKGNVLIEHLGGTDMAYGIDNLTNGKGTSAIATVEGATVKSTYRAIRQFLNGIEATNELYVKAGSKIYGPDNKSIWMQDPSANANTGKLVVEDGAELYGDVYLSVTAGSAEWPVEVSIADAALQGESTVLTSNVPVGYEVLNENGIWIIKSKYVAKIGEKQYRTLNAAVQAVEDGETITLVANETFTENNRYNNGGWWDGLGYSGDKSFTIDLNGKTISQDGSLNDYLIWIKNDGAKANTITFKNGTMDAGTTAFCALATASSNAQKMTVNLEDINLINNISNGAVVKARGGSELNVKAGTVITGKNSYTGIEAAGTNTVVNVYEGAEIYQNGTSSYVGAIAGASQNATLNIYGGYGKSARCGIIVMSTGATINVSGGEWIANGDGTVAGGNLAVLVSQNNRYETSWARKSILNVTGGTFKGGYDCWGSGPGQEADDAQINIKGGNFNANPANYVVAGYEATENAGIYTVDKPADLIKLEEAFAKGGNVTLDKDFTLLESIKVEKIVTLDLNGKTITAPTSSAFEVKAGGELTVKNGKVIAHESTVRAIGGKVIVESGEYTSTGNAVEQPKTNRYSLDCREGGELIINGGTFKSNNGMINVGSTVTVNGGKFENIVEKATTRHFAYVSASLTINDGEFYGKANSSAGGCFFCGAAAGGDIQVKGGKFTSLWTSGSVNRIFESYFGGNITVTGGMFNTNGGIATFVTENTDEATKAAYPYVAK